VPSVAASCFFFCLIILAFSLSKTMAAHYKTVSCLPSPKGSVTATQHPNKEIRKPQQKGTSKMTKESNRRKVRRQKEIEPRTRKNTPHLIRQTKRKHKANPNARSPWVTTPRVPLLLLHPQRSRRRHRPLLFLLIAVPTSLHWRCCPSHVGGPQEVEHCRAAPLIRQEVPPHATSASPFSFPP